MHWLQGWFTEFYEPTQLRQSGNLGMFRMEKHCFTIVCNVLPLKAIAIPTLGSRQHFTSPSTVLLALYINANRSTSETSPVSYRTDKTSGETSCDQLQRFCQHIATETFVAHRGDFSDFPRALLVPRFAGTLNKLSAKRSIRPGSVLDPFPEPRGAVTASVSQKLRHWISWIFDVMSWCFSSLQGLLSASGTLSWRLLAPASEQAASHGSQSRRHLIPGLFDFVEAVKAWATIPPASASSVFIFTIASFMLGLSALLLRQVVL